MLARHPSTLCASYSLVRPSSFPAVACCPRQVTTQPTHHQHDTPTLQEGSQ